ncbi:MAG: DNA polymerase III subunit alpha [Candidatus Margulisiibacteriota bacterium]|jgi:DNA polymerase-3 subunit alpha
MSKFVHLHCHSEKSLLDSPLRLKQIVDQAIEYNMPAVALTDNAVLFGAIEFYLLAKSKGIKPIIGAEMYLCADITKKERGLDRLILLAKDYQGYQNLIKLVTVANLDGFYYKPRIDLPHLAEFNQGLVAISPGLKGPIAYLLQKNNAAEAENYLLKLKDIYQDDFYLGLLKINAPMEDLVKEESINLAKKHQVGLVATNDVYYLNREMAPIRDILHCIQIGKKIKEQVKEQLKQTDLLYFKSDVEMEEMFKDVPEALENTLKIAEKCNLEIETERVKLPRFECPNNKSSEEYFKELVFKGLNERYTELTSEIIERINFEIDIILKMGFAVYFLIIYDFLNFGREQKIPIGPGRGSAAGSLVAYALNITNIDPLPYKLLFERFLNPERVSMPDIDLDFCIKRRNEIIDYILAKYGKDHVSQIVTFGTMAARGAIRDVGRVLDVPLSMVDKVAKLIPSQPGSNMGIEEAVKNVSELKTMYNDSFEIKELIDIAIAVEGLARHTSMHAAGVVISADPLDKVVPLIRNEGQVTTQYQMTDLEKIGLLKMDILGLRNLTVINDALGRIKKYHNIELNLEKLTFDDPKTYQLLCDGKTNGVFQLESRGMRELIKKLKPQVFEDLIALLALYRPGPLGSGMVNDFISNKSGETEIKYELPELETILKDTYGMIVYQEQVMQIASTIGGFSLGQADMMRRAMGKKKKEVMDKMKQDFLTGAENKGISIKKAEKIFELCYKFAEYGFNKSHSAAYALISYQTAYLKANFPKEYMSSLLSSILGSSDKISLYIDECKDLNLKVLCPDINESEYDFSIADTGIRFGLGAIKNVGEAAIFNIIEMREKGGKFKDFMDFCSRVDLRVVNKRVLESFIKTGAFDTLAKREHLLNVFEKTLEFAQVRAKEKSSGQISLFGSDDAAFNLNFNPEIGELTFTKHELLKMEKDLLGIYITGHPLDVIADKLQNARHKIASLGPDDDGKPVNLIGILSGCRKIISKNNKEMFQARLEDLTGEIPLIMFKAEQIAKFQEFLVDDNIVRVKGRIRCFQEEVSLYLEQVEAFNLDSILKQLHINIEGLEDLTQLKKIKQVLMHYQGINPVFLHYENDTILVNKKYFFDFSDACFEELSVLIGKNSYWVIK